MTGLLGCVMLLIACLLFSSGVTAGVHDPFYRDGHSDPKTEPRGSGLFHVTFADSLDAVTETQLAGNSLDEYPFFEYVKAFNEDATLELAIDPSRAGMTQCRIDRHASSGCARSIPGFFQE